MSVSNPEIFTDKYPDGFYLVKCDGKLTIAEKFGNSWNQIGIDYDIWQYSPADFTIEIIGRLDLDDLSTKFIMGYM